MKRTLNLVAALTLGAAAIMPLPSLAQHGAGIIVYSAPPAPRYESIPAPRSGYVWAPGYWNYDGSRHTWVAGHWEAARNGYQYRKPEWTRDDGAWRLNRGGWQQAAGFTQGDIRMTRIAPPRLRAERAKVPGPGYLWMPGYWNWTGSRHVWVRGAFLKERPGFEFVQPRWIERNGMWYLEPARWEEERRERGRGRDRDNDGVPDRMQGGADRDRDGVPDRLERRDLDRDGVPDAYDRDRDNDGVRNRTDADRDGDGYHNENDRYPDDPRRN